MLAKDELHKRQQQVRDDLVKRGYTREQAEMVRIVEQPTGVFNARLAVMNESLANRLLRDLKEMDIVKGTARLIGAGLAGEIDGSDESEETMEMPEGNKVDRIAPNTIRGRKT